jgi:TonB family protein
VGWILLWVLWTLTGAQAEPQSTDSESLRTQYRAAVQEITRLTQELARTQRDLEALKNSRPVSGDNAPASDFFLAGTAYITRQQYPAAVAAFTRAIERAPHDALAFRNRGIAHAQLGAHQNALHDLNTAITLDPQDAVAYNHRGMVYYALANPQQAVANFDKAIALHPKLVEAYNNRGLVWRTQGDVRRASKDFDTAAQLGMAHAAQHLQVLRDEIRQAQERLRQAGLNPGPADGIAGTQTIAALQQFQKTHGFPVTGLLDQATQQALGLHPPIVSPQDTAAAVPRFVHQPKPDYPLLARQQGWEGSVTLRLELVADGTIGTVQIASSSGHPLLDTAAETAAKTWTHVPATQDGVAVTRWVDITLTFTLDKDTAAQDAK